MKKIIIGFIVVIVILNILKNIKNENVAITPHTNSGVPTEVSTEFSNEQIITITGYDSDAMEPYISRDEKYLFFNNHRGKNNKDLFYAEKIDDFTFKYMGEIKGVNTSNVEGNPTMDADNNFYFISTRDVDSGDFRSLFRGKFNNGIVTNLQKVSGTVNLSIPPWLAMGVEIIKDGDIMLTSPAKFKPGNSFPTEGGIGYAVRSGEEFNIPKNEKKIFQNINTDNAIEYAGEISDDGLELFYSQVTLSSPPQFKLFHSRRSSISTPFEAPKDITEPFSGDKNAFVEGPTVSSDGKRMYYHKLHNGKFSLFMLSR